MAFFSLELNLNFSEVGLNFCQSAVILQLAMWVMKGSMSVEELVCTNVSPKSVEDLVCTNVSPQISAKELLFRRFKGNPWKLTFHIILFNSIIMSVFGLHPGDFGNFPII